MNNNWNAVSQLERDRQEGNCSRCHQMGHTRDWCPETVCNRCQGEGHVMQNCYMNRVVKSFSIQLPFDRPAIYGGGEGVGRIGALSHLLPYLQDAPAFEAACGVQLIPQGNGLCVKGNEIAEVIIGISSIDDDDNAETIIRVKETHVKIAAKYTISNGQLTEDESKPSTGSIRQTLPPARFYVFLRIETFDDTMMRIEVNGSHYLMFWRAERYRGYMRKAVNVMTLHGYQAMLEYNNRPPITSWVEYFFVGKKPKIEPAAETIAVANDEVQAENENQNAEMDGARAANPEIAEKHEAEVAAKNDAGTVEDDGQIAAEMVAEAMSTAINRATDPEAVSFNQYGFQRYFQNSPNDSGEPSQL